MFIQKQMRIYTLRQYCQLQFIKVYKFIPLGHFIVKQTLNAESMLKMGRLNFKVNNLIFLLIGL